MSDSITTISNKTVKKNDEKKCVKQLQQLILDDDTFQPLQTDEIYLLRFLHCTNFDVARALQRMKDYRNLVIDHPNWFAKTSPLEKKRQLEIMDKAYINDCDKVGRPIFVVKLGKLDVSNSCFSEQSQIMDFWMELMLDDPQTQANGMSYIVDMNGYSWRLLRWLTPSNVRIGNSRTDVYPLKELVVHVVNTSFLFNATIKLIWPFLNEKVKKMIRFHFDNWSSLHEYISPDILPPEYGGTGPEIDFEGSVQILFEQSAVIEARLKHLQALAKDN